MAHAEDQNKIHINPNFLGVTRKVEETAKVHFNPVFLNKSNVQNHWQSQNISNSNPLTVNPLVRKPPLPPSSKPTYPIIQRQTQLCPPYHPAPSPLPSHPYSLQSQTFPSSLFNNQPSPLPLPPKPCPKPTVELNQPPQQQIAQPISNHRQSYSHQNKINTHINPHVNNGSYKNPHVFQRDERSKLTGMSYKICKSLSSTDRGTPCVVEKDNYTRSYNFSSNNAGIIQGHTTFSSLPNENKNKNNTSVSRSKSVGEAPGVSVYKWTKNNISTDNDTRSRNLINTISPKMGTSLLTDSKKKIPTTNIIGSEHFLHIVNKEKLYNKHSFSTKINTPKNPYKIDNTKFNSIKDNYPSNSNEGNHSCAYKINNLNIQSKNISTIQGTINIVKKDNNDLNKGVSNNVKDFQNKSLLVEPKSQQFPLNMRTITGIEIPETVHSTTVKSSSKANDYKFVSKNRLINMTFDSGVVRNNSFQNKYSIVNSTPSKKLGMNLSVHRPSPKFPKRARTYSVSTLPRVRTQSEMSTLGKRYTVITKTKLIRRLSNIQDTRNEKSKYSVNTRTKLVRKKSCESKQVADISIKNYSPKTQKSLTKYKSISRSGTKCSLLSRTKLVRRSSFNASPKLGRCLKKAKKVSKLSRNNVTITGNKVRSYTSRTASNPIGINSKYKLVKNLKFSPRQRAANNIISKYKINNIPSANAKSKLLHTKYKANPMKIDRRNNKQPTRDFKLPSKYLHRKIPGKSDHIVNIGGILYKSTRTSLKKQVAKKTVAKSNNTNSPCIVHVRGDQFHLGSGGRTLRRVAPNSAKSVPRLHIGGLTYSQTNAGQYELTQNHQARAVLNSARHKSLSVLSQRRKKKSLIKRNEYCMFYNRFGRCTKKDKGQCSFIHDPEKIAVCTRFLRGRCPVDNCPFSHVIDPDKMPVCSHFLRAACARENCPYRHVRVNPKAPVCKDFLKGFCPSGQMCKNQHILECEDFTATGKCPRNKNCPLMHRQHKRKRNSSVSLEPLEKNDKKQKQYHNKKIGVLGKAQPKTKSSNIKARYKEKHPRYFNVVDTGKQDKVNTKMSEAAVDNVNTTIEYHSNREAYVTSIDMNNSLTLSTEALQSSEFAEKRKRLLEKVEKIKQVYKVGTEENESVSPDLYTVDHYTKDHRKDLGGHHSREEVSDIDDLEGCITQFQRRPALPKRLPSYIPLTLKYNSKDKATNKEESEQEENYESIHVNHDSSESCISDNEVDLEHNKTKFQRRPALPKRLPSYIPLSKDSLNMKKKVEEESI